MECTTFVKGKNRYRAGNVELLRPNRSDCGRGRRDWSSVRPSHEQALLLTELQKLLRRNKCVRREYIYKLLGERYGLSVNTRRFAKAGGVGTSIWLPKYRVIRLQVGASMMTSKKHCYMYAPCVEF